MLALVLGILAAKLAATIPTEGSWLTGGWAPTANQTVSQLCAALGYDCCDNFKTLNKNITDCHWIEAYETYAVPFVTPLTSAEWKTTSGLIYLAIDSPTGQAENLALATGSQTTQGSDPSPAPTSSEAAPVSDAGQKSHSATCTEAAPVTVTVTVTTTFSAPPTTLTGSPETSTVPAMIM